MRIFGELIQAVLELKTGALSTIQKGLVYFKTDTDRPYCDDGTTVDQVMMEKHLPEARRNTKVQLDDAGTGNEIAGVLPFSKGGTGQSSLAGQGGKALVVNSGETDFEFGEAGAGGDADTIHLDDADDLVIGDIDLTGQDPDFDGGGTITVGALSLSTTAADLISGETQVIKYDPNANGQNDYFGFTKAIPRGLRGRELGISFERKNDSTTVDDDFRFAVKQKDGANAGDIQYFDLPAFYNADGNSEKFACSAFIAADCTEIEYGWQNTTTTTTVELYVDKILVSSQPFTNADLAQFSGLEFSETQSSMLDRAGEVRFTSALDSSDVTGQGDFIIEDDSGNTRTKIVPLKTGVMTVSISGQVAATNNELAIYKNGSVEQLSGQEDANEYGHVTWTGLIGPSDFITVGANVSESISNNAAVFQLDVSFIAESDHIVTPAKSNLTNWTSYTPVFSGVGSATNVDFIWRRVGGGIEITGKFNIGTADASEMQIGLPSGLTVSSIVSSPQVVGDLIRNISTASTNHTTIATSGDSFLNVGAQYAGVAQADTPQNTNTLFSGGDEILIRAFVPIEEYDSNATFLAAVPVPKVAIFEERKTSGSAGGTSTSNTVHTRALNTHDGDTSFASLNSDRVLLQPGTYHLKGRMPGYQFDSMQAFLYDFTNSSYLKDGDGIFESTEVQVQYVEVEHYLTITSAIEIELRHWFNNGKASDGLGVAVDVDASNPQSNEIYSRLVVTKYA